MNKKIKVLYSIFALICLLFSLLSGCKPQPDVTTTLEPDLDVLYV